MARIALLTGMLVLALASVTGLTEVQAGNAVDALFDPEDGIIVSVLKEDGRVAISGFGTFHVRQRKARMGVNPSTGETIEIPASRAPAFKAAKLLKEALQN